MQYLLYVLLVTAAVAGAYTLLIVKRVVHDYETGLFYRNGRFVGQVGSGAHRIWRMWSELAVVDTRRTITTVPGQELLSADHVGLKISLAVGYQVTDPEKAVHQVADYREALYTAVQLALRSAVAARNIDELLDGRTKIGGELLEAVAPRMEAIGLKVHSIDVKDVMFPGELKKIFGEVVKAQKEGQAAMERVRAETASLRNLANAAKLLESNPNLLSLRVLQTIAALGATPGNSVVFGTPQNFVPLPATSGNHSDNADVRPAASKKRRRR